MDWADEIATNLAQFYASMEGIQPIATALRKARADGMRDVAAVLVDMDDLEEDEIPPIDDPILPFLTKISDGIKKAADKVERGEV